LFSVFIATAIVSCVVLFSWLKFIIYCLRCSVSKTLVCFRTYIHEILVCVFVGIFGVC
jgi:hypothetical protein